MRQLAGSPHNLGPACLPTYLLTQKHILRDRLKFIQGLKLIQSSHQILGAPCQNQKQEQLMSSIPVCHVFGFQEKIQLKRTKLEQSSFFLQLKHVYKERQTADQTDMEWVEVVQTTFLSLTTSTNLIRPKDQSVGHFWLEIPSKRGKSQACMQCQQEADRGQPAGAASLADLLVISPPPLSVPTLTSPPLSVPTLTRRVCGRVTQGHGWLALAKKG